MQLKKWSQINKVLGLGKKSQVKIVMKNMDIVNVWQ